MKGLMVLTIIMNGFIIYWCHSMPEAVRDTLTYNIKGDWFISTGIWIYFCCPTIILILFL